MDHWPKIGGAPMNCAPTRYDRCCLVKFVIAPLPFIISNFPFVILISPFVILSVSEESHTLSKEILRLRSE